MTVILAEAVASLVATAPTEAVCGINDRTTGQVTCGEGSSPTGTSLTMVLIFGVAVLVLIALVWMSDRFRASHR